MNSTLPPTHREVMHSLISLMANAEDICRRDSNDENKQM